MEKISEKRPVEKVLTEKLRPKKLGNAILLKRVRDIVENIRDEESSMLKANPLFYSVSPGTGKTTLTRILTKGCDVIELNASKDRGIDVIRDEVQSFVNTCSIVSEKPKVVIFEEMDGLTDQAFDALRALIEAAGDVRFIGNCNDISKIPDPIKSRFTLIPLFPLNKKETEELMAYIKDYAGRLLNYYKISYTDEEMQQFISVHFPNIRNVINAIQAMVFSGISSLSEMTFKKEYACEDLFEMVFDNTKTDPDQFKLDLYDKIIVDYSYRASDAVNAFCDGFVDYLLDTHKEYKGFIGAVVIYLEKYLNELNTTTNPKIVLLALVFSIYSLINEE